MVSGLLLSESSTSSGRAKPRGVTRTSHEFHLVLGSKMTVAGAKQLGALVYSMKVQLRCSVQTSLARKAQGVSSSGWLWAMAQSTCQLQREAKEERKHNTNSFSGRRQEKPEAAKRCICLFIPPTSQLSRKTTKIIPEFQQFLLLNTRGYRPEEVAQAIAAYFLARIPTVRPRRPVVLVCWPRTLRPHQ